MLRRMEKVMRIDKFLKISRIIKRRTLAQEAIENEQVKINGRVIKSSAQVQVGDVIEVRFGENISAYEVLQILETTTRQGAAELCRKIENEER